MPVPQALFYLVAILGASYLLLKTRRLDFYTVAFASALLYFLPGFFGFVRSSSDFSASAPLLPETYAVFIAVLLAIWIGAMVFDYSIPTGTSATKRSIPLHMTTETAVAVAALGLVATLLTSGDVVFSSSKSDVLENIGRWHLLFRFSAIFALIFAAARRQLFLGGIAFAFLVFDLFIGFRSGIVIGVLAAAVLVLNRRGPQSLLREQRSILVAGVLAIAFVLAYKQIYTAVKLGLWDTVAERLFSFDIVTLALINSEPFTTQSVLNEVLRTGFMTGPAHLSSVASLLVPFSNMLGADTVSYNDLFQERLFGGVVSGGLANNIWAQIYSIGGVAALCIGIPVYSVLLGLGSWLLQHSKGAALVLVALLFTLIGFYIHRNDIGFTLTLVRRCLMVWVVLIMPAMLIVDARRLSRV